MIPYAVALVCVVGMAAGQILFKLSANGLSRSGTFFHFDTAMMFAAAVCLYGVTSLAWVWALQRAELGRVYPLMALAFVIVPIGSYFFFGEQFPPRYLLGIVLIVAGIAVATSA